MAAYFNLNNNEISKELLVNKFNIILDNQGRLMLNDRKIPTTEISGLFKSSQQRCCLIKGILKKF